jgi:hypothetical protein
MSKLNKMSSDAVRRWHSAQEQSRGQFIINSKSSAYFGASFYIARDANSSLTPSPPCIYTAPQLRLHANTYETNSTYYTTKAARTGQRIYRENKHPTQPFRTKELSVHALVPYTQTRSQMHKQSTFISERWYSWGTGLST